MRLLKISCAGLAGFLFYMFLIQRPLAFAVTKKAMGKDEPCPWAQLLRYPWESEKFADLKTHYLGAVIPREIDAKLNIQRFDTPTRPFWLRVGGHDMDAKTL